jgi:hypothetical protein
MTPERRTEIAKRAYDLWELEGRPAGRDLDHWLRAEIEIDETWRVAKPQAPMKRGTARQRRKAEVMS